MARIEIVPETRVAYTVFPGWEHEARSQIHRQLVQNRLITSSPAAPISRERHRRMSLPGTATLDRPGSTAPSLGNATEPSNMDRSAHNGLSFRPDIVCSTTYVYPIGRANSNFHVGPKCISTCVTGIDRFPATIQSSYCETR